MYFKNKINIGILFNSLFHILSAGYSLNLRENTIKECEDEEESLVLPPTPPPRPHNRLSRPIPPVPPFPPPVTSSQSLQSVSQTAWRSGTCSKVINKKLSNF